MDKLDGFGFKVMGTRDYCKLFLWIPKLILYAICLWPEAEATYCPRYIFLAAAEILFLLLSAGIAMQCIYVSREISDIFMELICVVGLVSAMIKFVVLFVNNRKLQIIIEDIMNKFWPSDLVDDGEVKKEMKTFHSTIIWIMVYLIVTFLFGAILELFVVPLIYGGHPVPVYVPLINYKVDPFFAIVYFGEIITVGFFCDFVLMGFDLCFMAICSCLISQFKLFCNVITTFNTPEMVEINTRLREVDEKNKKSLKNKYKTVHEEFFVRCVQHHQLLLRTVYHINNICGFVELVQITFTITGICLGLFVLTTLDNLHFLKVFFISSFITFSLNELFLYCAVGNELHYQASLLPHFIFKANWHQMEDTKFTKNFMFMLRRSQDIPKLTSYNLYNLNLNFYVQVLKFAFSIFTFLTTIRTETQQ